MTLALIPLLASCAAQDQPEPPRPGVVAMIDDLAVTDDDLRQRFHQGPAHVRLRALRAGGRHFLLNLVIDETLLAREAQRRGLSPCYSDIQEVHRPLMRRFLAREFEPSFTPADVPEEEIRAEYERSLDSLREPARRQIHLMATDTAEQARELIDALERALTGSDEPEIHRLLHPTGPGALGNQSGLFDRELAETYLGAEAAEAAFSLQDGHVFSEPIRSGQGWGVVVVRGLYPAVPPPSFEEAAHQLRRRVYDRMRDQRLDRFVEGFLSHHRVTFDPEAAALIP